MQKDFTTWANKKSVINDKTGTALFHEREVWWCVLGINIGYEQDGGQEDFGRPVIIIKKFNLDACLIVPLTTKSKSGKYYLPVGSISGREAVAVLSQVRFIDRKRLSEKICTLEKNMFKSLVDRVVQTSFMDRSP